MPRIARRKSLTGYYHIMIRGVNRQVVFKQTDDYYFFIFLLRKYSNETHSTVYAYCLMTNHIHLLINTVNPAILIKKISSAYVKYYNKKYSRVGHLFQERYKSENIEDEMYFCTVLRYVLRNPQKAKIANYDDYPWNSWSEFLNPTLCDVEYIESIFGGLQILIDYMNQESKDKCIDIDEFKGLTDDEIKSFVLDFLKLNSIEQLQDYSRSKLNSILYDLKQEGLSINQISLATNIDRNIVQRAKN